MSLSKSKKIFWIVLFTTVAIAATHVYQEYTCEIIKNANGDIKLKYYNASDVLTSVDITN